MNSRSKVVVPCRKSASATSSHQKGNVSNKPSTTCSTFWTSYESLPEVQNIPFGERLRIRSKTYIDKVKEKVPKPPGTVPASFYPSWHSIPLEKKIPRVPAPPGTVVYARGCLGTKLHRRPKTFCANDPKDRESFFTEYSSLHDPYAQNYYCKPEVKALLLKQGLVTKDGQVVCSQKEFNRYREYLRTIYSQSLDEAIKEDDDKFKEVFQQTREMKSHVEIFGPGGKRDRQRVRKCKMLQAIKRKRHEDSKMSKLKQRKEDCRKNVFARDMFLKQLHRAMISGEKNFRKQIHLMSLQEQKKFQEERLFHCVREKDAFYEERVRFLKEEMARQYKLCLTEWALAKCSYQIAHMKHDEQVAKSLQIDRKYRIAKRKHNYEKIQEQQLTRLSTRRSAPEREERQRAHERLKNLARKYFRKWCFHVSSKKLLRAICENGDDQDSNYETMWNLKAALKVMNDYLRETCDTLEAEESKKVDLLLEQVKDSRYFESQLSTSNKRTTTDYVNNNNNNSSETKVPTQDRKVIPPDTRLKIKLKTTTPKPNPRTKIHRAKLISKTKMNSWCDDTPKRVFRPCRRSEICELTCGGCYPLDRWRATDCDGMYENPFSSMPCCYQMQPYTFSFEDPCSSCRTVKSPTSEGTLECGAGTMTKASNKRKTCFQSVVTPTGRCTPMSPSLVSELRKPCNKRPRKRIFSNDLKETEHNNSYYCCYPVVLSEQVSKFHASNTGRQREIGVTHTLSKTCSVPPISRNPLFKAKTVEEYLTPTKPKRNHSRSRSCNTPVQRNATPKNCTNLYTERVQRPIPECDTNQIKDIPSQKRNKPQSRNVKLQNTSTTGLQTGAVPPKTTTKQTSTGSSIVKSRRIQSSQSLHTTPKSTQTRPPHTMLPETTMTDQPKPLSKDSKQTEMPVDENHVRLQATAESAPQSTQTEIKSSPRSSQTDYPEKHVSPESVQTETLISVDKPILVGNNFGTPEKTHPTQPDSASPSLENAKMQTDVITEMPESTQDSLVEQDPQPTQTESPYLKNVSDQTEPDELNSTPTHSESPLKNVTQRAIQTTQSPASVESLKTQPRNPDPDVKTQQHDQEPEKPSKEGQAQTDYIKTHGETTQTPKPIEKLHREPAVVPLTPKDGTNLELKTEKPGLTSQPTQTAPPALASEITQSDPPLSAVSGKPEILQVVTEQTQTKQPPTSQPTQTATPHLTPELTQTDPPSIAVSGKPKVTQVVTEETQTKEPPTSQPTQTATPNLSPELTQTYRPPSAVSGKPEVSQVAEEETQTKQPQNSQPTQTEYPTTTSELSQTDRPPSAVSDTSKQEVTPVYAEETQTKQPLTTLPQLVQTVDQGISEFPHYEPIDQLEHPVQTAQIKSSPQLSQTDQEKVSSEPAETQTATPAKQVLQPTQTPSPVPTVTSPVETYTPPRESPTTIHSPAQPQQVQTEPTKDLPKQTQISPTPADNENVVTGTETRLPAPTMIQTEVTPTQDENTQTIIPPGTSGIKDPALSVATQLAPILTTTTTQIKFSVPAFSSLVQVKPSTLAAQTQELLPFPQVSAQTEVTASVGQTDKSPGCEQLHLSLPICSPPIDTAIQTPSKCLILHSTQTYLCPGQFTQTLELPESTTFAQTDKASPPTMNTRPTETPVTGAAVSSQTIPPPLPPVQITQTDSREPQIAISTCMDQFNQTCCKGVQTFQSPIVECCTQTETIVCVPCFAEAVIPHLKEFTQTTKPGQCDQSQDCSPQIAEESDQTGIATVEFSNQTDAGKKVTRDAENISQPQMTEGVTQTNINIDEGCSQNEKVPSLEKTVQAHPVSTEGTSQTLSPSKFSQSNQTTQPCSDDQETQTPNPIVSDKCTQGDYNAEGSQTEQIISSEAPAQTDPSCTADKADQTSAPVLRDVCVQKEVNNQSCQAEAIIKCTVEACIQTQQLSPCDRSCQTWRPCVAIRCTQTVVTRPGEKSVQTEQALSTDKGTLTIPTKFSVQCVQTQQPCPPGQFSQTDPAPPPVDTCIQTIIKAECCKADVAVQFLNEIPKATQTEKSVQYPGITQTSIPNVAEISAQTQTDYAPVEKSSQNVSTPVVQIECHTQTSSPPTSNNNNTTTSTTGISAGTDVITVCDQNVQLESPPVDSTATQVIPFEVCTQTCFTGASVGQPTTFGSILPTQELKVSGVQTCLTTCCTFMQTSVCKKPNTASVICGNPSQHQNTQAVQSWTIAPTYQVSMQNPIVPRLESISVECGDTIPLHETKTTDTQTGPINQTSCITVQNPISWKPEVCEETGQKQEEVGNALPEETGSTGTSVKPKIMSADCGDTLSSQKAMSVKDMKAFCVLPPINYRSLQTLACRGSKTKSVDSWGKLNDQPMSFDLQSQTTNPAIHCKWMQTPIFNPATYGCSDATSTSDIKKPYIRPTTPAYNAFGFKPDEASVGNQAFQRICPSPSPTNALSNCKQGSHDKVGTTTEHYSSSAPSQNQICLGSLIQCFCTSDITCTAQQTPINRCENFACQSILQPCPEILKCQNAANIQNLICQSMRNLLIPPKRGATVVEIKDSATLTTYPEVAGRSTDATRPVNVCTKKALRKVKIRCPVTAIPATQVLNEKDDILIDSSEVSLVGDILAERAMLRVLKDERLRKKRQRNQATSPTSSARVEEASQHPHDECPQEKENNICAEIETINERLAKIKTQLAVLKDDLAKGCIGNLENGAGTENKDGGVLQAVSTGEHPPDDSELPPLENAGDIEPAENLPILPPNKPNQKSKKKCPLNIFRKKAKTGTTMEKVDTSDAAVKEEPEPVHKTMDPPSEPMNEPTVLTESDEAANPSSNSKPEKEISSKKQVAISPKEPTEVLTNVGPHTLAKAPEIIEDTPQVEKENIPHSKSMGFDPTAGPHELQSSTQVVMRPKQDMSESRISQLSPEELEDMEALQSWVKKVEEEKSKKQSQGDLERKELRDRLKNVKEQVKDTREELQRRGILQTKNNDHDKDNKKQHDHKRKESKNK